MNEKNLVDVNRKKKYCYKQLSIGPKESGAKNESHYNRRNVVWL